MPTETDRDVLAWIEATRPLWETILSSAMGCPDGCDDFPPDMSWDDFALEMARRAWNWRASPSRSDLERHCLLKFVICALHGIGQMQRVPISKTELQATFDRARDRVLVELQGADG